MMRLSAAGLALGLLMGTATAAKADAMQSCRELTDSLQRLVCYDRHAEDSKAPAPASAASLAPPLAPPVAPPLAIVSPQATLALPASPPVQVSPPLQATVPPPPPSPPAQPNAYAAGRADRLLYETWVASLVPVERAGAEYWAGERNAQRPIQCIQRPEMGAAWLTGCMNAKRRLDPSDARRKAEPEYKTGWSSVPEDWAPPTATATASPSSAPVVAAVLPGKAPPEPEARAEVLTGRDIARLRREFDADAGKFRDDYAEKASFRDFGQFQEFSRVPVAKPAWMAIVMLDNPPNTRAFCFYDHNDETVSKIAVGERIKISGKIAMATGSGIGLAGNCSISPP